MRDTENIKGKIRLIVAFANGVIGGDQALLASVLSSSFFTVYPHLSPEQQKDAHARMNDSLLVLSKDTFDRGCCEDCVESQEVIDVVMKAMRHTETGNAIQALSTLLRILMDSTRDDNLTGDVEEQVLDTLFPDTEERRTH